MEGHLNRFIMLATCTIFCALVPSLSYTDELTFEVSRFLNNFNSKSVTPVASITPLIDDESGNDYNLCLEDLLTVSANFDTSYRNTQYFESGYNGCLFQGDTRLELWMPPFRRDFSWGPYLRFAGIVSCRSFAWENNWNAKPGYGFHLFPISFPSFKKKDSSIGKMLGPLRLFAEYNQLDYWGKENRWRPERQVRAGADYWKALHVNNVYNPWWAEIWGGLFWQSANEFDRDYDTLILGSAVHFGIRKPNAGILSSFTPYVLLESSLTENDEFYWENKLQAGVGVRYAPMLRKKIPVLNLVNRFVIYAEFRRVLAYYHDSAPSSVPDYDFLIGTSFSIGEWYR